jgi:hypothetical protein
MINDSAIKKQINWNAWAPPIFFLLFLIIEKQAFGTFYTSWLYGLILIIFGIIYAFRYKLYQPAVIFCLAGITLWHYVLAEHLETNIPMLRQMGFDLPDGPYNLPFSMVTWIINLLIFLVMIPIFGPVAVKSFRLEQSAKKLFRIASQTVHTSKEGFTTRPFYAGNTGCSKEQITGFTQYLSGHLVVYPVFTEQNVFLTFSMGKSPLSIQEPSEISYIAFDYNGNITVHIDARDYRKFRKKLTFDTLCDSMGSLFKRFMDYYLNNQESRIITEIKTLR